MGIDLRGVARIAEHRVASSFGISKVTMVDFSQLWQRSKKSEKMFTIVDMFSAASKVPFE